MKNLVCVKSIMTVLLTVMLCVMVYMRPDDYGDVFKNIVVMVATFYFSYQGNKVRREIDAVVDSVAGSDGSAGINSSRDICNGRGDLNVDSGSCADGRSRSGSVMGE